MNNISLSLDLMAFVETKILPKYNSLGKSHGMGHIKRVISHALELAEILGADADMAYVIAAYHDLGMGGPRAIHHITGGKILMADRRLTKWFSPTQLKIMKEAIEDHRASSSHTPRSIYGKIIAEADRELERDIVFKRAIMYGLEHYPELSKEEHWDRFQKHMIEKYSTEGYITLWIPNSPNQERLKEVRRIIDEPKELRMYFDRFFEEITAEL